MIIAAGYTRTDVRRWLLQLGFSPVPRLPRVGRVLIVEKPAPWPGVWRVQQVSPGAFSIEAIQITGR